MIMMESKKAYVWPEAFFGSCIFLVSGPMKDTYIWWSFCSTISISGDSLVALRFTVFLSLSMTFWLHCTCFHHSGDTASLSSDTPFSKTITSLATFPARFHSYNFSTIRQWLLVHIIFCAYNFCAHYMYIFYFFLITLFFTKSHTLITLCA